jgi:alpha-tubulin suppressor-like RCC1 family protein
MANRVVTNFIDDDGLDIGCHLVSKEYVLEAYPELVPWMKAPALWGWGSNLFGLIGDSAVTARSSPVQTISGGTNWKQISATGSVAAGIKTDGSLWLWGVGANGRLGTDSNIYRSSPVQTITSGTNWQLAAPGAIHSTAIKTDGSLWTWGRNNYGQLGTNTTVDRSSPVQTISSGTNWKSVGATLHNVAIKTDGTLWTWGFNTYGQLGNNNTLNASSPVQTLAVGTNWKTLSAGRYHSAAIKTDGSLWLWGCGFGGALGANNNVDRSSPVQTISSGTNWKQVSISRYHSAAIKTDGSLWLWGRATAGLLGTDNNTIGRSSPVQTVSAVTNWRYVELGYSHSTAIKTDGTLWVWGCGLQLGTNNIISRSSPVQTVSGGTGWKSIAASTSTVFAIRDEGEF